MGGDTLYPSNGLGDMLIGLMNESLTDILWIRSIGGYNNPTELEHCAVAAVSDDGFYVSGRFGGPFSIDTHQAIARGGRGCVLCQI